MKILEGISAILAFRTVPTTVLLALIYATIFSTVLITDELPYIPRNTKGLDLEQAYTDLHQITARPHPYNSHANDIVRSFILERVNSIASQFPHVIISNDLKSTATFDGMTNQICTYYEGDNILVKIDGSDSNYRESGGVLFSAHFDSVSTAPGATDDGMGVVTLLQMVEYLAKNRPQRTVVFNINNGEEDGLNGARVFMEHPWSNISDIFLNLEGAAAGGRPILFRATSQAALGAFYGGRVPHPHANVISGDAFRRGAIQSGTDYSIYEAYGMEGLDLAFYKGRSRYHTKYDSIAGMEHARRSLWAMMEATLGAGQALINDGATHDTTAGQRASVYFDLFGATLVMLSLRAYFVMNIVLLVVGPLVLFMLFYSQHIVQATRYIRERRYWNPSGTDTGENIGSRLWREFKELNWLKGTWIWAKFWVALVLGAASQALLVLGYSKLNPYILHTHPFLVFTSMASLFYLTTVLSVLYPLTHRNTVPAPEQQKLVLLLQNYIFTWVLLVFSTHIVHAWGSGSFYIITAWNGGLLLASILACMEGITGARGFSDEAEESRRVVRGVRYEAIDAAEDGNGNDNGIIVETEPTEITPLIQQRSQAPIASEASAGLGPEQGAIGWWIPQMLLVVPLPALLTFHIVVMIIGASSQTLTDGNSPALTYAALSFVAFFVVLPIAPFSINTHRFLTILVLIIFLLSTAYSWFAFPFSQHKPMKIYFAQTVYLNDSRVDRIETALSGPKGYLTRYITPSLPSSYGKPVECQFSTMRTGLETCTWRVGGPGEEHLIPSPGGRHNNLAVDSSSWFTWSIKRSRSNRARFVVQGRNTKACSIRLDNRRITNYRVLERGDEEFTQCLPNRTNFMPRVQIWTRERGKKSVVDVEWAAPPEFKDDVKGEVVCEWAEYESGGIGEAEHGVKIPALEEALTFLPEWSAVTKLRSGLVEVHSPFVI